MRFWVSCALAAAIAVVVYVLLRPAHAHDQNNPELNQWFTTLHSPNGMPCCDGTDAHHIADPDWDTKCDDKGCHYRVMLEGKWYDVPDSAVVTGPNKAGVALVWTIRYGDNNGNVDYGIRCFMPGTGT